MDEIRIDMRDKSYQNAAAGARNEELVFKPVIPPDRSESWTRRGLSEIVEIDTEIAAPS